MSNQDLPHPSGGDSGAAGFYKAQMARRNARLAGKIELAHAAALTPCAELVAEAVGRSLHAEEDNLRRHARHYL